LLAGLRPSSIAPIAATSTAALYFAAKEDLVLLVFSTDAINSTAGLDLRFEDAAPLGGAAERAGDFPHVYGGAIPWSCLAEEPIALPWDAAAGAHTFPAAYTDGLSGAADGKDDEKDAGAAAPLSEGKAGAGD
jgi:uncharacterized protein (DUF952 family)